MATIKYVLYTWRLSWSIIPHRLIGFFFCWYFIPISWDICTYISIYRKYHKSFSTKYEAAEFAQMRFFFHSHFLEVTIDIQFDEIGNTEEKTNIVAISMRLFHSLPILANIHYQWNWMFEQQFSWHRAFNKKPYHIQLSTLY